MPIAVLAYTAAISVVNFTGIEEPRVQGHQIEWPYLLTVGAVVFVLLVGYTFYGYQSELDERGRIRTTISRLAPLVAQGNRLMDMYARPESPLDRANQEIWPWHQAVQAVLEEDGFPEYVPTWNNDGDIFDRGTRSVMALGLAGRTKRLGEIIAELRRRL